MILISVLLQSSDSHPGCQGTLGLSKTFQRVLQAVKKSAGMRRYV